MRSPLLVLALLFVLSSCTRKDEQPTDIVTFAVRGEVVAIDTAKMRVTLDHEEIPDYMMAMTMPFRIKNRQLFDGLQIGDTVQGVLAVSRTESWLEKLTVVGRGDPADPHQVADLILAKVFRAGDPFPDDPLVNQEGKKVRMSDFAGKAVAITFIYTRCPLPDFCILMSNNFAKIQKQLKADRRLQDKWQLVTVSFDPTFDTPNVLKDYGRSYGADFATWQFVTGEQKSIYAMADGLGLTLADDEGLIAHNLRTVLLDKEGRIAKVINGNEWTPEDVVREVRRLVR